MTINLLQRTLYEINKKKKSGGYEIIENENAFVIIWNNPKLYYFDKAHCDVVTENTYTFFKETYPFSTLSIACNQKSLLEDTHSDLVFKGTSDTMILERSTPFKENNKFKIRHVENKEDTKIFSQIACEVYNLQQNVEDLTSSLNADLKFNHCHKYIGYDDKDAAGTIECSEGKDAVFIAWVAVKEKFRKRGLCSAMLTYALNKEIERNFHKFVLVTSPEAKSIYTSFGFKDFAIRYNYTLKCKK